MRTTRLALVAFTVATATAVSSAQQWVTTGAVINAVRFFAGVASPLCRRAMRASMKSGGNWRRAVARRSRRSGRAIHSWSSNGRVPPLSDWSDGGCRAGHELPSRRAPPR